MDRSLTRLAVLTLAAAAGIANAQPGGKYASGLLHEPVGEAKLGAVDGRRLVVHNLGSSGEDGVEIVADSAWGVATAIEAGGLTSQAGTVKIKHKGWDGLIYKRVECTSTGDGSVLMTVDFSDLGAIGIRTITYGEYGGVASDVTTDSPYEGYLDVPNCPDGRPPVLWHIKWWSVNEQKYVYQCVWSCEEGFNLNGDPYPGLRVMIPIFPVGTPEEAGIESMIVTSSLPELAVTDASLQTLGVSSYGLGGAQLHEECTDPLDCTREKRKLVASNIGSSGQDGVSVVLHPRDAQSGLATGRRWEGWDMRENTKFYDDEGNVMLAVSHTVDAATGTPALSLDFSGIGVLDYDVTCFGPNGEDLGEYRIIGGTPPTSTIWNSHCPSMFREIWMWDSINHVWYFVGCDLGMELVIPGGPHIGPVASMRISPVGGGDHNLARAEITGSDIGGDILVEEVTSVARCPADFDGTGFVDTDDFDAFVQAFEAGTQDADFDLSGFVDTDDFDAFVRAFEAGC